MSNTDSFIEEVSDEVRQDQLFAMYKKYGWIAALLIALIIGGVVYSEWSKAKATGIAEANGDALIAALDSGTPAEQAEKLATLSNDAGAATPLVQLQQAAILANDNKTDAAAEVLNTLATAPDAPAIYKELAALKHVILLGNTQDSAARHAALDALAYAGAPFRTVALEQKALVYMDDADTTQAQETLASLLLEPGVTAAMRARVEQTLLALGGDIPTSAQALSVEDGLQ